MRKFIAIFNQSTVEVEAETYYKAKQAAAKLFQENNTAGTQLLDTDIVAMYISLKEIKPHKSINEIEPYLKKGALS